MKARSRLKPEIKTNLLKDQVVHQKSRPKKDLSKYIKHSPLLIVSVIFFLVIYQMITNYYPDEISNFLFYRSFLSVLIPFYFGVAFLFSYILLNLKRGFNLSLLFSIILFLKLQMFEFEYLLFVPLVIVFVIVDLILLLSSKNEKIAKKSTRQNRRRH